MADEIKAAQIPPHVAAGQLWFIDGIYYRVLFVGDNGGFLFVTSAAYGQTAPLTWMRDSYTPEPLAEFCKRTHRRGAKLLEGAAAPWG